MAPRASISALLVRPLLAYVDRSPGALASFFRATDLTAQMVEDPETRISPSQFCVAWAEAIRLCGDPTLALRIAGELPAGTFGIVEYVCRSAPSVREALERWVRYLGILDDAVEVGLVKVGADTALRVLVESEAPAPASHELCFGVVLTQARRLVGKPLRPVAVRFEHRAPVGQLARYRAFFDTKVEFGASHTELLLSKSALETPLATADPNLLAILAATAEEKRAARSSDAPITEQVRRALRAGLGGDGGQLEVIARRLGLTARSLQRRLREEGTSFQTLRDGTRQTLADHYLGRGMTLSEISFLLGFSEPSAFFRAFKRWTGVTPIARRQQQRAHA